MNCPHCHRPISRSAIARAVATSGERMGAPPKVLRPCPHCGELYSTREWRAHKPQCAKNPRLLKRAAAPRPKPAAPFRVPRFGPRRPR